jgi:subtilisin family serine protease
MTAPACLSNVIAVGATDDFDNVAGFSNSNASTDLMAPGAGIVSSALGNGTVMAWGTSMASPMAAGCAALLIAAGVAMTPDDIEAWLESSPITVTNMTNGLSFPRLDCTPPVAPESVTLAGPVVGFAGVPVGLHALVQPMTTTTPLTYAWAATGQASVVHTGTLTITDGVSFTWAITGTQTITVTAANVVGVVTDTVVISVTEGIPVYLPAVLK